MALPKIEHPIHEVYLKSLDRKIKFRPFLVKEEKILLIAKEAEENSSDIKNAIKQVIQNCCLETDFNVEELPLFDIEMLFVHLRIRSVGESAKLSFTCHNVVDDNECGNVTDYTLDLTKVHYDVPEGHSQIIKITDTVGLKLKYPTMAVISDDIVDEYSAALKVIVDNIDYIYDAESIYKGKDVSREEIIAFLDELNVDQITEIRSFFTDSPKAVLEDNISCTKCGFEHKIKIGELYSFFT